MSVDDMLAEYWAHRFYDDPKAGEEVEDDGFDLQQVLKSMEDGDWEEVTNGRYQDPR